MKNTEGRILLEHVKYLFSSTVCIKMVHDVAIEPIY